MKKILLKSVSFITILTATTYTVQSQNRVFDKAEMVNFDKLNLMSVTSSNQWSTDRTQSPGKFANYGAAKFVNANESIDLNSAPEKWINGYVKHYATEGNTSHVFPVGDDTSRFFLSTNSETPGKNISVAWISGKPNIKKDLTAPYSGIHYTNPESLDGLSSILDIGQWDWITEFNEADPYVTISVKIPPGYENSPSFCLAGWRENKWHKLSDASAVDGMLTAYIRNDYSALALGKKSNTSKNNDTVSVGTAMTDTNSKNTVSGITFFNVYPNPVKSGNLILNYCIKYTGTAKVILYDMMGKAVLSQPIVIFPGTNTNTIDTSRLSVGCYILEISDANNNLLIGQKKIIIQY